LETGEPYLLFIDEVNRNIPEFHKKEGLVVKTSNLCSEITLATSKLRTAVCCLFQINQLYFDEWKKDLLFIEDCVRFTDNVLQIFVDTAPEGMVKAKFSASQERSIGIGVMGFHSYLQSKMIPYGSAMAKSVNLRIGKHINDACDAATHVLALEKGPCPDAAKYGVMVRNANVSAIAPTASTSIILAESSPAMEPMSANAFTQKTLSGSFSVRNKFLEKLLEEKGMNTAEVWSIITTNEGSVQSLDFLTEYEKDVFKTAMEIDPLWIIEHASVRQPFVDQAISTNVYLPANVHKSQLLDIHIYAWKKGLKSLYYCRSKSLRRADKVSQKVEREIIEEQQPTFSSFDAGDCLGCQ
jgi:ribonucleoside-diphosphate reductase alpha chain